MALDPEKVPVRQKITVDNHQDFNNRMRRRDKLPGLVVLSAINGAAVPSAFRRLPEGLPRSRYVSVCFPAHHEVEGSMTFCCIILSSSLLHRFRRPDLHPMNIIDLYIGPHRRRMKQKKCDSKLDNRIFPGSFLLENASTNTS